MKTVKPNGLKPKLLAAGIAMCFAAGGAYANPVGPAVVNGQATFAARGNLLSVTNTPGAIINWQQFSIGTAEVTRFIQQSAASAVLNRVVGIDPSRLLGALQSNGRVVLINPNGIVFGAGAQIDVGGLVASTLDLSNRDFLAGRMNFTGDPARAGQVVNQGRIAAGDGGRVYLIGSAVDNQGVVAAPNGDVVLAAGNSVRIAEGAARGVQVEITAPADQSLNLSEFAYGPRSIYAGLVRNSGVVSADSAVRGAGGSITFKASHDVVLDAGGRVSANGLDGGRIMMEARQGAATVAGSVEATGSAGRGGSIAISGEHTGIFDGARVDASGTSGGGSILVGGDFQGRRIEDGDLRFANSQRTYVAPTATLRADAIASGDGGKVIVWSDQIARYYGNISARGGAQGGKGGSVEVSGKQNLTFDGKVDTSAVRGSVGSLLLDPNDLYISVGAVGGATEDSFNPFEAIDGSDHFVTALSLQALVATTAVTLQASNDIIFQTGLAMLTTGAGSISMTASNQIQMATFGLTTAGGGVSMTAGAGGIASLGAINLAGGTLTLNSSGSVSQSASAISGNTSVVKQGTGTLTLSSANTFTGTTTVTGGILSLSGGNAIADTVAVSVGAAGTLNLQNNEMIGALTGVAGSQVTLNANTLTTGNASNTTFAGVISGSGGALTKQGTGTFTLTGANTYTGTTTVNAGTLAYGVNNALASGAVTVSGGTLDISTFSDTVGVVTLVNGSIAGTGVLTGTSYDVRNGSISAILAGPGALSKTTPGTVTLSGANTYAGATAVNAGTLAVTVDHALGDTAVGTTVASGATLDFQNVAYSTLEGLTLNGGTLAASIGTSSFAGAVTLSTDSTAAVGVGAQLTLSGAISGATFGLTKTDTGTLVLGASNLLDDALKLIVNGGTFDIAGFSDTVAGVQLQSGSIIGSGTLTSTTPYGLQSGTVSAILGGAVGLNKTTTGTVILSGVNAYTGATAVNEGTLAVTVNGALGTIAGATTVAVGATLDFQNVAYNALEPLTLNGGTIDASTGTSSFANAVTMTASSSVSAGSGARLTFPGVISGAGLDLTKTGAGTVALGASNRLDDALKLIVSGGTFDLAGFSDTVAGVQLQSGSIANTGLGGTLTSTSTFDLQGGSASAILTGAVGATKTGGGTVTLSGANTYGGVTTINAGVLSVNSLANGGLDSNIGKSSNAATNLVLGGGTLQYTGGSVTIDRSYTLSSGTTSAIDVAAAGTTLTLMGSSAVTNGVLAKTGAGTLAMGASNLLADTISLIVNGGAFDIGGFSDTVAGVRLLSGSITGTNGTLTSTSTFDLQGGSASAILTGTVGATKTGGGTVTLSGANTYGGATTINAGVLSVSSLANGGLDSNIGKSSNAATNLVLGGGTLQYTGASVSNDRNFTLSAGTTSSIDVSTAATNLTLTGAGAATNGALTKIGSGTLTLQAANTYTGLTTVSAGTLAYGVNNALASGPVTVSGGTWDIGTFSDAVGIVTLVDGSIAGTTGVLTGTFYDVRNGSISAILAGLGTALTKTTSGTVTLSGNNTYTGTTTVSGGTLALGAADERLNDLSNLVVDGTGTFDIGAFNETVAGVLLNSASGTITGTSGVLTSNSNYDLRAGTVNAHLTGPPGIGVIKTGPGTVTLSRTNTYTGTTAVNEGTLAVTSNDALGTAPGAAGTTVASGATLDFQDVTYSTPEALTVNGGTVATSIGTSSFAGPVSLVANSIASVTGTQLTLSGVISESGGSFGLTKIGAGTLVLSGDNTYKGTTKISEGTLALGGANERLDDLSKLVVDGGTFDIRSFNEKVSGVQLLSGTITGGIGVLNSTTTYDLRSGTVSAILTDTLSVGLNKNTTGTVTLTRDNTYTGATAVDAGTLVVTANNALGGTAAGTTVASGATLSIVNAAIVAEPVRLNGVGVSSLGALTGTGTASLDGSVTIDSASTIGVTGAADALTLFGVVEGPGALSLIGSGTLTFGNTVGAGVATALASLTQDATTRLNINGGLVRTTGGQIYNGPVTTSGATTLQTTANGSVTANGVFTATAGLLTLDTGAGDATLNNALNNFGTVEVTSGRAVSLVDANGMTLGDANLNSVTARTLSGNLILGGNVTATGAGDSIVLVAGVVAGGNFINNAGANALHPGAGRWLVYSTDPALDTRGGLVYDFKQYNATFLPVTTVLGAIDKNGFLYRVAPSITPSLIGATKVYDATTTAALSTANFSFSGVIDGDVISLNPSSGTYDTTHVGAAIPVSVSGLSLSGVSNGAAAVYGYKFPTTTATGSIGVITPASLTVTANDQTKTYGQTFSFAPTEFTSSGLRGSDKIDSVLLTSAGAPAAAHVADSPYAITPSAATGSTFAPGDYTIIYKDGQLTVNQALLTVTANDQTKAYGGSPFVFAGTEFKASGLQNVDAIDRVTLMSDAVAPTAPKALYPITPSAAIGANFTPGNYAITYVDGKFTVNEAGDPLTITAKNQIKSYGTTFAFAGSEFTAIGLQNGETVGRVVLASPGAPATAHAAGSPYVISANSASGGTFTPGNYTITYVDGQLTVVPAALTVKADDKSRFQGTANPPFTATYKGLQLGETPSVLTGVLGFSTPATTISPAGTYPIVPSGQTSTDYAIAYVDGSLAVSLLVSTIPDPLLAELRHLGIEDLNQDVLDCPTGSTAPGSAAALAAPPKGVFAKQRRKCKGAADLTVVPLPRK